MSHHFTSVCRGLLVIAGLVCVAEVTKGIEAEAPPPAEPANSQPVDASDSQPPDDYDGNTLYRDIELAKSTIERATKQLEEHPKSVEWRVYRGIAHSATGDFFSALMDFEDAMAVDLTSPEPHRALGYVYRMYHRPDKALACYNKAIELGSKSIGGFMGRAGIYYYQGDYEAARAEYDEAIRLHPDHTMAWLGRAMLPNRDWDEAKSDYDKAIELSEHAPYIYAYRAQAHFDRGEYDEFCADILTAMKNNPGDVGVDYDPLAEQELSDEDLKFGKEQLRNMLRDRPEMAEWVEEGDELWNWTLRRFAGSAGVRVSWDPSSAGPTGGVSGEHDDGSGSWIRVAGVSGAPAELLTDHLWSAAIFELHNCAEMAGWIEIVRQAREGSIDRDTFLLKAHDWEESTLHRVRACYVRLVLPCLIRSNKNEFTSPVTWHCGPHDFITNRDRLIESWKQGIRWSNYGKMFDITHAELLMEDGRLTEAIALIEATLDDPEDMLPDAVSAAKVSILYAWANQGDYEKAIAECQELLTGDLTSENEGHLRFDLAQWLYYAHRLEEAQAEIEKAIALLPDATEARMFKAHLLAYSQDMAAALAELDSILESIDQEEHRQQALFQRAQLRFVRGELQLARRDLDDALQLTRSGVTYWLRGCISELEHDHAAALADYDSAIASDDALPAYSAAKARLLLKSSAEEVHDPEEAAQLASWCCNQTAMRDPEYLELLGQAHAACGRFAEAIHCEQKAMLQREQWHRFKNLERIAAYKQSAEEKSAQPEGDKR